MCSSFLNPSGFLGFLDQLNFNDAKSNQKEYKPENPQRALSKYHHQIWLGTAATWVVTSRENGLSGTLEIWRREEEHSNVVKQSAQALQAFIYLSALRWALLLDLEVLTTSTDQKTYIEA